MSAIHIGLVACCAAKAPSPEPAGALYRSSLFRKAAAAAATCDAWAVLSARLLVVRPDEVAEPYDQRLPSDRRGRLLWANRAARALAAHLWLVHGLPMTGEGVVFVVFAGAAYRQAVEIACRRWCVRAAWRAPLTGMGIGEQLHWLTVHADRRHGANDPSSWWHPREAVLGCGA